MQHFRAEISQFGSFVEADDFDAACVGADSGVGGEDAVNISPDFDTLRAKAGSHDGGRKI